jgi:hypothetical protein
MQKLRLLKKKRFTIRLRLKLMLLHRHWQMLMLR